jgi:monofunctional glycosyltransferase
MLKRLLRFLGIAIALFYAAVIVALVVVRFVPPPTTLVQVQRRVESWFEQEPYSKRRRWVSIDRLPPYVPRALLAAEDSRFYEHFGFDWREIQAADEEAGRGRRRRGASTITQQLVKNLFFTTHRSVVRKGLEITITPLTELILPKRRILELYLNEIEFGRGIYGIEAAARHHYQVPAARLSRDQAARLAAIVPAPRRRVPQRMDRYAGIILRRMDAMGW